MSDSLAVLGLNAAAYAACYVKIVEALVREGVTEEAARFEARLATMDALLAAELPDFYCPICGHQLSPKE